MIVLCVTDCPPSLRGDITRWLCEINAGVYVGNASARVRDELWKRVCENLKTGRATMVFSARNEQGLDFYVSNTSWEPIDFDGIKLMLRPSARRMAEKSALSAKAGQSKAAEYQKAREMTALRRKEKPKAETYVVIDIETTGLSSMDDEIIEMAAIRVNQGEVTDTFESLVTVQQTIPKEITKLTGITDELLKSEGRPLTDVLKSFLDFVGDSTVVAHNAEFDYAFIRIACQESGLKLFANKYIDTLKLARQKLDNTASCKLESLAKRFELRTEAIHRALDDCLLEKQLYEKLNNF